MFSQHICWCGHGIHMHVDYVSMCVHQCAAMNCAAYYPKVDALFGHGVCNNVHASHCRRPGYKHITCSASLIEHMPVMNMHRSPTPLPYGADVLPFHTNAFTGDATNIPFTPVPIPSPSTSVAPSYSYGRTARFLHPPHSLLFKRPSLRSTLIPRN